MPQLIEFEHDEDRLRAIDLLDEADETYSGVPPRRFLLSNAAVRLLRGRGVRLRVIGGEGGEEEQDASQP